MSVPAELLSVLVALLLASALSARIVLRARADARVARATADRHRAVVRSMPDVAVLVFDRELRWIQVEGDALAGKGWRADELEGRRPSEALPPDRGRELEARFAAALAGETQSFEWDGVRGGAYRVDVAPIRDGGGAIARGVCLVRDISAGRRLRNQLDVQREFFAAALEQLAEPVFICDAHGQLILVNAAARALHGIDADHEPGGDTAPLDWPMRMHLRDRQGEPLALGETPLFLALQGEQVRDSELIVQSPGDGRRRLRVSAGPVDAAGGERLGAVAVGMDVTEEYAGEMALRASEQRYRSVVQDVDDAVFQADRAGRFTFLNDAFERWTGHPAADALGRPAWEFVHPDDRTAHGQAFAPLLAGDVDHLRHRHRYVTAGGEVRWAEVRARTVSGHGIAGVIEDVTERRRAEEYELAREAIAQRLAAPGPTDGMLTDALEALCRGLDWDAAELWTMEGDVLRATVSWQASGTAAGLAGSDLALEVGEGGPGRAWALRGPVWVADLAAERECPRAAAALRHGARSELLLPVVSGRRVHAVVVLLSCTERAPDPAAARPLDAIAAKLALYLERADAERLIARQALDLAELRAQLLIRG